MKYKIICSHCGSADVQVDAYVTWDVENQNWIVANVFKDAYCENCSGEISTEREEITQ